MFLILLGASRPQPREHPDSRSGWRWRSWPRSSLREGVQGGSAGSGWGWGGAVPVQGLRPGVCRAPGRRLPATEGLQRSGDRETPKSYRVRSVSSGVSRQGAFGMHFALGHPRPLLPALWGHWDGTKPSATNQRPHWSLRSKP